MRKADARLVELAASAERTANWLIEEDGRKNELLASLIAQQQVLIEKLTAALELLEDAYYNGDIDPRVDAEIEEFLALLNQVPTE